MCIRDSHGRVAYKLPEMTEFIFQCGSRFSRDDGFVGRAVFHLSENMSQKIGERAYNDLVVA